MSIKVDIVGSTGPLLNTIEIDVGFDALYPVYYIVRNVLKDRGISTRFDSMSGQLTGIGPILNTATDKWMYKIGEHDYDDDWSRVVHDGEHITVYYKVEEKYYDLIITNDIKPINNTSLVIGEYAKFEIDIKNTGTIRSHNYTVVVYDENGNKLEYVKLSSLEAEESKSLHLNVVMIKEGSHKLKFAIEVDENPSKNKNYYNSFTWKTKEDMKIKLSVEGPTGTILRTEEIDVDYSKQYPIHYIVCNHLKQKSISTKFNSIEGKLIGIADIFNTEKDKWVYRIGYEHYDDWNRIAKGGDYITVYYNKDTETGFSKLTEIWKWYHGGNSASDEYDSGTSIVMKGLAQKFKDFDTKELEEWGALWASAVYVLETLDGEVLKEVYPIPPVDYNQNARVAWGAVLVDLPIVEEDTPCYIYVKSFRWHDKDGNKFLRYVQSPKKKITVLKKKFKGEGTAPIVTVNSTNYENTGTIELIYKDNGNGIAQKQYSIETSPITPSYLNNYKIPLSLISGSSNKYIHYRAMDNLGNVRSGRFGPYDLKKQLPEVSINNKEYGIISTTDFSLYLDYSANEGSIKEKQYKITNSSITPSSWDDYIGNNDRSYIRISTPGSYYIHYRAVDTVENINIGYFGPYILNDRAVQPDNIDYSAKNNDITVNLRYLEVKYHGEKQYQVTNSTETPNSWINYTGPIKISKEGMHYIHYRSVDREENVKIGYFGPYKKVRYDLDIDSFVLDKTNFSKIFSIGHKSKLDKDINGELLLDNATEYESAESIVVKPLAQSLEYYNSYKEDWNLILDKEIVIVVERKSDGKILKEVQTNISEDYASLLLGTAVIDLPIFFEDTSCYIYVKNRYEYDKYGKKFLKYVESPKKEILVHKKKSYDSNTIDCKEKEEFIVNLTGMNLQDSIKKTINITYDSSILELIDLCSITNEEERTMGERIEENGIVIKNLSLGTIQIIFNKSIPEGKLWSGFINGIKFKAIKDGITTINHSVE